MFPLYKELIVVLCLTVPFFLLARRVFTAFMTEDDFISRRNIWLALTVTVFLAPNIWIYMAIATAVIIFGASRDRNPGALYVWLLFVVPPIQAAIPGFGGVNSLFTLDNPRMLSIVILMPLAFRLMVSEKTQEPVVNTRFFDLLVLVYVGFQVSLLVPYQSITESTRGILIYVLELLLPYYVFSRSFKTAASLREVIACLVMGLLVLAPLAMVESLKGWLFYNDISSHWGLGEPWTYMLRGDLVRAGATTVNSISLGYLMAIGLIGWLYLRSHLQSTFWSKVGLFALGGALIATLARGPWLGVVAGIFVFIAFQKRAGAALGKFIAVALISSVLVMLTPYGEQIIESLPFVGESSGNIYEDSVAYRKQLFIVMWGIVEKYPFFGTPLFLDYMEEMRQGQGLIDTVNTYLTIAASSGGTGLAIFAVIFLGITWKTASKTRKSMLNNNDFSMMGASLVASMIASMVILATVSFMFPMRHLTYVLAGLCLGYVRMHVKDSRGEEYTPDSTLVPLKSRKFPGPWHSNS